MGNDLKQKILVQNGVISEQQIERKPSILNCPRLVQGHKDHKVINKMFVIPSLHVIC